MSLRSQLDLGNLPNTSFSCEGKVVGGYYADFETGCQMFHVCTLGSKGNVPRLQPPAVASCAALVPIISTPLPGW